MKRGRNDQIVTSRRIAIYDYSVDYPIASQRMRMRESRRSHRLSSIPEPASARVSDIPRDITCAVMHRGEKYLRDNLESHVYSRCYIPADGARDTSE